MDLISRQAAKLKVAGVVWEEWDSCYDFHDKCVDCLDDVPSAEPERKKGEWMHSTDDDGASWICSECMTEYSIDVEFDEFPKWAHFCPNCGAAMFSTHMNPPT